MTGPPQRGIPETALSPLAQNMTVPACMLEIFSPSCLHSLMSRPVLLICAPGTGQML